MITIHPKLQEFFQEGMRYGNVPEWMTKCRAVLIQKDLTNGTPSTKSPTTVD